MGNIVKQVEFMGDSLLGVKNDDGVYVGVRWICQGLGLTEGQGKHQLSKIQSDIVLFQGVRKIVLPTSTGDHEVICLDITYLPLWLAKINANIVKTEIQGKLIEYQLKAKDVLAEAFVSNPSIPQLPQTMQEALRQLADSMDTIEVQRPKVQAYDSFMDSKGFQSIGEVAKALGVGRNKLFDTLKTENILMSNNLPYQRYAGYFHVIEGVRHGFNYAQTMVLPRGVDFIDRLLHPMIDTWEDVERVVHRIQG